MKFRRILAALLGALMITSVMSFTANVSAAEGDIIFQSAYPTLYGAERGKTSVHMYDAENDIVFSRMTPNFDLTGSCYINISGQTVVPTAEQIANDSIYVVFYVRTNMALDENDKPSLSLYNAYWGPDAINQEGTCSLVTGDENFIEQVGNDWGTLCFKLNTTKTISGTQYSINKWTQFACFAVGTGTTNPIADWTAKAPEGEIPNMDCAGYAVVSSLEAAKSYDFTKSAKAPQITLTFEIGNGEEAITEKVTSGTWNTAGYVEFPEITAPEGMVFAGWYNGDTKIENTEAVAVPTANTTYTAQWYTSNLKLDSLMVNGTTASTYGVTDINAEEIVVKLPYGWAELEALGVMPAIEPVAASLVTAAYTAPASLSESGKITLTSGEFTKEITVNFAIGAAPAKKVAGINNVTGGVYSTSGVITLPDSTQINTDNKTRAVGLKSEKTEKNGIDARKFIPIYKGSELDGTMVSATEYYSSNRSVNLEGYGIFGTYDFESYNAYRALVYYDTGADGAFDIEVNPRIYFQTSGATGTFLTSGAAYNNGLPAVNTYKGNRWEYIYIVKTEKAEALYGKAVQPVISLFHNNSNTKAFDLTDDFYYFAEIVALPDVPEFVQYAPTGLVATNVTGRKVNGKPLCKIAYSCFCSAVQVGS